MRTRPAYITTSPDGIGEKEMAEAIAVAEKTTAAEKYVSYVRALVVAFNTIVYLYLVPAGQVKPVLAVSLIIVSWVYLLVVIATKPYKRFPVLYASYFTSLSDGVLITLWIYSTGGFESPFHGLWIISILAIAFRYSMKVTLLSSAMYAILYLGLLYFLNDHKGHAAEISVRIGYIFLAGVMASLITKEILEQTQQKHLMKKLADDARISEEKLREQTELYENLVKVQGELGEGVIISEGQKILFVNEALCSLYGYTPEELIRMDSVYMLFSRLEKNRVRQLVEKQESGKGETLMVKKNGEFIFASYSFKVIRKEKSDRIFFLFRDVTETKKAEADLIQRTLDLERSRALQSKKDEFIGIASHELKTPLTSIKAYIQLIDRTMEKSERERLGTYLQKAGQHIDKLNNLIADLLDVSKIQAGKLQFNFSEFNFGELVKESIESIQYTTKTHRILLEGNADINIVGDRQRLEQVFENFLSNAIKYSPKSDKVIVRIGVDIDQVNVAVRDFGIGISQANQKKIFNRFYRAEESSSKFSGLGIGLYISSEILKRHAGKAWVESESGNGSTFNFTLPIKQNR